MKQVKTVTKSDPGLPPTLAMQKTQAEAVTPEALEQFLHGARMDCHAYDFRISIAREAQDPEAVKTLQAQAVPSKKRQDYFEKELASRFPEYKPTPGDFTLLENRIVLNDYFEALKLKRDAKIASDAAKALDLETEKQMALQDMQRALRYIKVLEPRFKRLEKHLEKKMRQ